MRGKAKFVAASGQTQDEGTVRMDYNTSKRIGNVRYGKYYIFYQAVTKWVYIDYNDLIWVYRRLEDVQSKLRRGEAGLEVHSIMLVTRDRKRIGVPVGDKENAVAGLELIQTNNSFVDIGFSKEKEEKYL